MRRVAPFLLAVVMATLPPSLLLLFISGLASSPLSACTHHGVCVVGDVVAAVAGSGAPPAPGSGSSGFVAATRYAVPSRHPYVAAAAASSLASAYAAGGKPAESSTVGGGTPRRQGGTTASNGRSGTSAASSSFSPGVTVAEAPPDTLKVSVLGGSRGKSTDCTFSLVEFSNTVSVAFLFSGGGCVCPFEGASTRRL